MSEASSVPERGSPRPVKASEKNPEFETRAHQRQELLMKTHEFRRKSVREFEVPEKDYFEYDEKDKRRF